MDKTTEGMRTDLLTCMADLEDPRHGLAQLHELLDIVVIAICAIICGADHWTEVEAFGKAKQAWLSTFLALPHGIPSHDTFGRVFRYLDPEAFEASFRRWTSRRPSVSRPSGRLAPSRRSRPGTSGYGSICGR